MSATGFHRRPANIFGEAIAIVAAKFEDVFEIDGFVAVESFAIDGNDAHNFFLSEFRHASHALFYSNIKVKKVSPRNRGLHEDITNF